MLLHLLPQPRLYFPLFCSPATAHATVLKTINGYTKCEISDFFILDNGCKGARSNCAKSRLIRTRNDRDLLIFIFSRRVIQRWNQLEQHVVDASSINSFKSHLQRIRETGFLWIPLNSMSLTCGLTAAEATQGKEQGKDLLI